MRVALSHPNQYFRQAFITSEMQWQSLHALSPLSLIGRITRF